MPHLVAGDLRGSIGMSEEIRTRCWLPCCCWPNFGGQAFQLSWNLSAFSILETQAQLLQMICMRSLLHFTSG